MDVVNGTLEPVRRLRTAIAETVGNTAESEDGVKLLQRLTTFLDGPVGYDWPGLLSSARPTWLAKQALLRLGRWLADGKITQSTEAPPAETVLMVTGLAPDRPKRAKKVILDPAQELDRKLAREERKRKQALGAEFLCTLNPQYGLPTLRTVGGCQAYRKAVSIRKNDAELVCGHCVPLTNAMRVPNTSGGFTGFTGLQPVKAKKKSDLGDGAIADAKTQVGKMEAQINNLMPKRKYKRQLANARKGE